MTFSMTRFARLAAASALSAALAVGPALADGPSRRGSIKDPVASRHRGPARFPPTSLWRPNMSSAASRRRTEGPAIQGGFDATCGIFYAGVWASNLDFGGDASGDIANIEIDLYAGIKPKTGRITWDLGVIYYTYPNAMRCRPPN